MADAILDTASNNSGRSTAAQALALEEPMISRRTLIKSGAGTIAAAALGAPAIAQAPQKISFLTWNIIDQEPMIRGWIARFLKDRPGVEV